MTLHEVKNIRQIAGDPERRWFVADDMDLTVWFIGGHVHGFQLCYEKGACSKALTWFEDRGFSHHTVDEGESQPARRKQTPILIADGVVDKPRLQAMFDERSARLEAGIRAVVRQKLNEYIPATGS